MTAADLANASFIDARAPESGRRKTLVRALAHLADVTEAAPALIVEVGTIRRMNGCLGDGWATRVFGWYAAQTGSRVVSIDTSATARAVSRRVCRDYVERIRYLGAPAERLLAACDRPIDLLYMDGPSDPAPHLAILKALKHRPRLVLWDDIVTEGDPAPGFGPDSREALGWLAYARTAKPWANKGETGIPYLLELGYEIVFAIDRQVLLLDPTAEWPEAEARHHAGPLTDWCDLVDGTARRVPPPRRAPEPAPEVRAYAPASITADYRGPSPAADPTIALVIGGGATVWEDLEAVRTLLGGAPWPGIIIAVNDVAAHLPFHVEHWATLHAERLHLWQAARAAAGHEPIPRTWSRTGAHQRKVTDTVKPYGGGSSGLLAVAVAEAVGATRCILAGVPMTKIPHFGESRQHKPEVAWKGADAHFRVWRNLHPRLASWVRSCSGRTRDLLGPPTSEFILP